MEDRDNRCPFIYNTEATVEQLFYLHQLFRMVLHYIFIVMFACHVEQLSGMGGPFGIYVSREIRAHPPQPRLSNVGRPMDPVSYLPVLKNKITSTFGFISAVLAIDGQNTKTMGKNVSKLIYLCKYSQYRLHELEASQFYKFRNAHFYLAGLNWMYIFSQF